MAKDIKITDGSELRITENSHMILDDGSQVLIKGREADPLYIRQVQNIAPVATHIKEVNHIDPITIDALFVNEVRNIEPISVDKFNVTNLPTVNLSVRQIPSVDLNIRRLPALSVGTHQEFHLPSCYTVRAQVLGIELFRIHLQGETKVVPRERFRREQDRLSHRSYPQVATAGNPAIPSHCREKGDPAGAAFSGMASQPAAGGANAQPIMAAEGGPSRDLSFGRPGASFALGSVPRPAPWAESHVSMGE